MILILKRDAVWLGSLPSPHAGPTLLLLGRDGQQVAVPAPLLLAASPLVRSILTGHLPPAYGPCFLSLPSVTEEVLHVVVDILTTGEVVVEHEDNIEKVKVVFCMLGIDAFLVSCHVESIQVGQMLEKDIKAENCREGTDFSLDEENIIKFEVIVKTEDKVKTDVEESKMLGLSPCPKSSIVHHKSGIPCKLCSKSVVLLRRTYVRHPKTVLSETEFPCHLCPRKFTRKQDLENYIKSLCVHSKKEITCDICSQKFTRRYHLVRHIKSIHEQIKIACNLCPKKFTQKHELNAHIRIVHEQIKISCDLCPQMFTTKKGLVVHIESIHDLIKFPCNLCCQKFTLKKSLWGHIKSVHDQIKTPCNLCQKKFTRKSYLVKHIRSVHHQIKIP